MPVSRSPLHTWLQLFRAPNLFTVPGDPLAGFLLSSPAAAGLRPALLLPITASLCFYAAGLLLNDLMDLDEDCAERPSRPLPSGAARTSHVWLVTGCLFAAGLALCAAGGSVAFVVGAGIVASVAAYDCRLKKYPVAGVITMGLCRGLSVLLGAAFATKISPAAAAAALVITCYIAGVTQLARFETTAGAPGCALLLPLMAPVMMLLPGGFLNASAASAWILAAGMIALVLTNVRQKRMPLPPAIGALIRVLLMIQAFYCFSAPPSLVSKLAACALIALWPVSRAVSKRFYAS